MAPEPEPEWSGSPGSSGVPVDRSGRDRIESDLSSTLFVEAGAGSGKTAALVGRVLALVTTGESELAHIAAITFTEKAAAELRDRVRARLTAHVAEHPGTPGAMRAGAALDQLDGAAIGTLHAFARRILSEHPIEAGLPPGLEVMDEVASQVAFERRWGVFRDELLADPSLERTLLLLFATGVTPEGLRFLARTFEDNWDLVEQRVPDRWPGLPSTETLLAGARRVTDDLLGERCSDPTDKLLERIQDLDRHLQRLSGLDDELDLVEALGPGADPLLPSCRVGRLGRSGAWHDVGDVRSRVESVGHFVEAVRPVVAEACIVRIASIIRRFTLTSAEQRRAAGQLRFHDLLVLARELLCDPAHGSGVRVHLHERYRHILLDEFQDTDPLQMELAVRIAARRPGDEATGSARWEEIEVAPGRLFVVGDPKQSIYRFRRADVSTFLTAGRRLGEGGGRVELTSNFRTGREIVGWVNAVFGRLMGQPDETDLPVPSQPAYLPLVPTRPGSEVGPPVSVLGRTPGGPSGRAPAQPLVKRNSADGLRADEADGVARAVARILEEGWTVSDTAGWRPATLGDIAILVPARTSLPFLENALDEVGIAFRTESSSLVYTSRAVRDLLMVARAVDDPSNHLWVVSALRTPILGCGDDDLFRFVQRGGRWNYLSEQPDAVPTDDPVVRGLEYLRRLHQERHWATPSELLGRIAREGRAFELGFAEGRPRDVWRRLRFVIDQARSWSEATGGTLRQYLGWVALQAEDAARVSEAVLPETDDDAVRIMTIHSAKGLEFPITIVSGLTTAPSAGTQPFQVAFPPEGGVAYRFTGDISTGAYRRWKPVDDQMARHERARLLYVACTRARDHLVVSVHRAPREHPASWCTNAELLAHAMGDLLDELPDAAITATGTRGVIRGPTGAVPGAVPPPPPPFSEWHREREAALRRSSIPRVVAATALTDEGNPDVDPEPPPGLPDGPAVEAADSATGSPTGNGLAGPTGSVFGAPSDGTRADGATEQHTANRPSGRAVEHAAGQQESGPTDGLAASRGGSGRDRGGRAVGRAVHGVLQTVDLGDRSGLDAAVAARCEAEAIPRRVDEVRRRVAAALRTEVVREAAASAHWREMYVCVPVGQQLLEGYLDLCYRGPDGLVVVDYKTVGSSDGAELERRMGEYRNQGASYALALAEATGEPVARVVFVFLGPEGASVRELPDLEGAVGHARELVRAGRGVLPALV